HAVDLAVAVVGRLDLCHDRGWYARPRAASGSADPASPGRSQAGQSVTWIWRSGASLAKEARAEPRGQYAGYGLAARPKDPAGSGVRLRGAGLRPTGARPARASDQDFGGEVGPTTSLDELHRLMEVGVRVGESLGERQRVPGLDEHVQAPRFDLQS